MNDGIWLEDIVRHRQFAEISSVNWQSIDYRSSFLNWTAGCILST